MKASPKKKPGFQVTTLLAGVTLLMIVFITVGYFFLLTSPDKSLTPEQLALQENRALWDETKPEHFEYEVERDCRCDDDIRRAYRVIRESYNITFRYSRNLEEANLVPPEPETVETLFQLIAEATTSADAWNVMYNATFGYPEVLFIDWDVNKVDDEQRFIVREFRQLH